MSRMIVPDKRHSLPTKGDPALRAYIAVGGQPLAIYEKERHGKSHLEGTITVEPGAEFEVGVYAATKKKPKTSGLITVQFGTTTVLNEICDFRSFDPTTAADSVERFTSFDGLQMHAGGTRKFTFAQLPTTDDPGSAVNDVGYLKEAASITIKYAYITGLTYGVTGWEKADVEVAPIPESVTASDSTAGTEGKAEIVDELNSGDFAEDYKHSLRPIDELDDKGKFSMVAGFGPLIGHQGGPADRALSAEPEGSANAPLVGTLSNELDNWPSEREAKPVFDWTYDAATKPTDTFVFHLRPPTLSEDDAKPADGQPETKPIVHIGNVLYVEATPPPPDVATASPVGESLKRPFKRRKVGQTSARSEAGDVQPPVASSSGVGAAGATLVSSGTQKERPAHH